MIGHVSITPSDVLATVLADCGAAYRKKDAHYMCFVVGVLRSCIGLF